jgi:hypothetical protein
MVPSARYSFSLSLLLNVVDIAILITPALRLDAPVRPPWAQTGRAHEGSEEAG